MGPRLKIKKEIFQETTGDGDAADAAFSGEM
jgi:hypothetical protein